MYEVNAETREIFLYDEIGSGWYGGIDASTVIKSLAELSTGDITVRINSPGGDVIEAIAIYNALDRHRGRVTVQVDSLAASAGSYIAMVGDEIVMADNAMMMIHSPWTVAMGNAKSMRETADLLDKFQESLVVAYSEQSKKNREDVIAVLEGETWLTAAEAVEQGFADRVGERTKAYACVPMNRFKGTPEHLISASPRFAAGINRQISDQPKRKETPLLNEVLSSFGRRRNS